MQLPAVSLSLWRAVKTLALCSVVASSAHAQLTLNSIDRGRYSEFGTHIFSNYDSYLTGQTLTVEFRNFLVFDTTAVTTPVTAASLRLFLPQGSFTSPRNGSETLRIYDVSTSIPALTAFQIGANAIFNDLGSGTEFGSAVLSESLEGSFIDISLNAAFLGYVNTSAPDIFAFGGALGSLSGFLDQYGFLASGTGNAADGRTQLLLWTAPTGEGNVAVPEPSTYGLIGAGLLLVGVALRRRFAARKA